MKLALAQINPKVGDIQGNLALIGEAQRKAQEAKADLLVFPELALLGYPPRDLLLRRGFLESAQEAFAAVIRGSARIPMVIGHVAQAPEAARNQADPSSALWHPYSLHNAAFLLAQGEILGYQAKLRLPSFDVFEEERYFLPAEGAEVFTWNGLRLGLSVCEDFWYEDGVLASQCRSDPDLLINISASPYFRGKPAIRWQLGQKWAKQSGAVVAYANLVGGQDELVFDGHSFVIRPDGQFLQALPGFETGVFLVDLAGPPGPPPEEAGVADLERALVLGTRDYFRKNGIAGAVVGISGGVDSAVVAALAAQALGREHVLGAFLPGPYTADLSQRGAEELSQALGIPLLTIPIDPAFAVLRDALSPHISTEGVVAENLQARIRGVILMALANARGYGVLCPANKSEIAMGYNTLYGDTVGALAPLGDLVKAEVYALAKSINEGSGRTVIPEEVLARPPSAELRPNQRDDQDLPPYPVLDEIVKELIEGNRELQCLFPRFGKAVVAEVAQRLQGSEYKRKQLPLVIKVSPKAFGMGRRYPITCGFVG